MVYLKYLKGGVVVLPISTDGDDQRIFGGFKILIRGFFWVGKFDKDLFGWLDLRKDFLGYSEQSEVPW